MIWTDDYDGEFSRTEQVLGWMLAIVLSIGFVAALTWIDRRNDARLAEAAFITQDVIAAWREDLPWKWLTLPLALSPFFVVPGVFGTRSWRLRPSFGRRVRLRALSILVVAMSATLAGVAAISGHRLGVATTAGVTWRHDDRIVATAEWKQAKVLKQTCLTGSRQRSRLSYRVLFKKRRAELSPLRYETTEQWIDRVGSVPMILAAAGVPAQRANDARCVEAYAAELEDDDRDRFSDSLGQALELRSEAPL